MNHDFFSKPMPHYVAAYDSAALRGVSGPRPWNTIEEVRKVAGCGKALLDIGCGTSFKLVGLAKDFERIVGVDISRSMVATSNTIFTKHGMAHATAVEGSGCSLPFDNESFDVVSAMLSRWHVKEINRVLKPGGWAIVEMVGSNDKTNIKMEFGSDLQGLRGQNLEYGLNGLQAMVEPEFRRVFASTKVQNGTWDTYLTRRGLLELLTYTPCVRAFDLAKDAAAIEGVCSKFMTPQGILTQQNRLLFIAEKGT